jgi:hypothetical protein
MDQSYPSFLYVVSQKMIPHFYVLGFGMEHWVLEDHVWFEDWWMVASLCDE